MHSREFARFRETLNEYEKPERIRDNAQKSERIRKNSKECKRILSDSWILSEFFGFSSIGRVLSVFFVFFVIFSNPLEIWSILSYSPRSWIFLDYLVVFRILPTYRLFSRTFWSSVEFFRIFSIPSDISQIILYSFVFSRILLNRCDFLVYFRFSSSSSIFFRIFAVFLCFFWILSEFGWIILDPIGFFSGSLVFFWILADSLEFS